MIFFKNICIAWFFAIWYSPVGAQPLVIDSLQKKLAESTPDTNRVSILSNLALANLQTDNELSIKYAEQGVKLARQLNFKSGEADCLRRSGIAYFIQGRYPEALDIFQKALVISESINHVLGISAGYLHIGNIYAEQGDYKRARFYYNKPLETADTQNYSEHVNALKRIGESYLKEGNLDSALAAFNKVFEIVTSRKINRFAGGVGGILKNLGQVAEKKGNHEQAMTYFRQAIPHAEENDNNNVLSDVYFEMASLFKLAGETDSCIFYSKHSLAAGQENRYAKAILSATQLLAEAYEPIDAHEALRYHKMAAALSDSLFNTAKATQVHNLFFLEQQRQQELEVSRTKYNNRLKLYSVLAAAFLFLLLVIVLYRINRNKQKANTILNRQKQEIQEQRAYAEKALEELKAAQALLIQAEKMASLGEMTAGIAHEIQNPLNFVNNFSEVNKELIEELKAEQSKEKSGRDEKLELEILNDISANEEKINQHGKRAEAIVKGMLLHSRTNTGQKEPTDINALADEYLRLAYHGTRAKDTPDAADNAFKAAITTDFDNSIGKINIVPQDIGRVLLNLYNNAFYSVNQSAAIKGAGYEPIVTVTTKKEGYKVLIIVADNGPGIPQPIIDKIFQPFFTTKPTGEGTGLGLSLSYDIVKAHGGEIKVSSKEGELTAFTVILPAG